MIDTDYNLYLGCIAPLRYPGIEVATRETCERLGIKLHDMMCATCCPAPGIFKSLDKATWLVTAARNLSIANENGFDVLTICNGCFGSLYEANQAIKGDEALLKSVNGVLEKIGRSFTPKVGVRHYIEILYNDVGLEKVKESIQRDLSDLKVVAEYGCHFLRPSEIKKFDEAERPKMLDELIELTGAKSLDYPEKLSCCGAGGGVRSREPETSLKMLIRKLDSMKKAEPDAIVDMCSFCHLQFDRGQKEIEEKFQKRYDIPVLHYSQLLGIAQGMSPEELGMYAQETPVEPLMEGII